MSKRMKHCAYCGEELGEGPNWDNEPESCGKQECNREVNYMNQAAREDRRSDAEQDDYSRY